MNAKIKGQGHMNFLVFFACMILFEPVGLHSRNVVR